MLDLDRGGLGRSEGQCDSLRGILRCGRRQTKPVAGFERDVVRAFHIRCTKCARRFERQCVVVRDSRELVGEDLASKPREVSRQPMELDSGRRIVQSVLPAGRLRTSAAGILLQLLYKLFFFPDLS